jgi:hypothetical protein
MPHSWPAAKSDDVIAALVVETVRKRGRGDLALV